MMLSGSRQRNAWIPWSARVLLKRATVALFHSSGNRSAVVGAGGPSSPATGFKSSFSLAPVACCLSTSRSEGDPLDCCVATASTRERKRLPSRARPLPLSQFRRLLGMRVLLGGYGEWISWLGSGDTGAPPRGSVRPEPRLPRPRPARGGPSAGGSRRRRRE